MTLHVRLSPPSVQVMVVVPFFPQVEILPVPSTVATDSSELFHVAPYVGYEVGLGVMVSVAELYVPSVIEVWESVNELSVPTLAGEVYTGQFVVES